MTSNKTAQSLTRLMVECSEVVHRALLGAEFRTLAEIVGMGADGEHTKGIDQVAEIAALEFLEQARPRMNVLSEEAGYIDRGSSLTAIVDPIDSTINATSLPVFDRPDRTDLTERATQVEVNQHLFGYPYFAFSIGIFEDGQPVAGCVRNLPTAEIFTVVEGRPVELDGVPVRGSGATTIAGARIAFVRPETTTALRAIESMLVGTSTRVRIAGCSALDLALIGSGILDGVVNPNRISPRGYGEKIVDWAGGWPMVLRTGGKLSHNDGSDIPTGLDLSIRTPILAATTLELHAELVGLIDSANWDEVGHERDGSV
ncbi:MAG: inositol monophosphatase family protein [Thermomicrobiales bacterium]